MNASDVLSASARYNRQSCLPLRGMQLADGTGPALVFFGGRGRARTNKSDFASSKCSARRAGSSWRTSRCRIGSAITGPGVEHAGRPTNRCSIPGRRERCVTSLQRPRGTASGREGDTMPDRPACVQRRFGRACNLHFEIEE
jgi:hypothetical protein